MSDISFKQVFKGSMNVLGSPLSYPQTQTPEIERWIVSLPPQSVGNWHIHLVPEFFYVQEGTLTVVNELTNKSLAVTTFGRGEQGLTDCHVPQFIWNPHASETVVVTAIYFGSKEVQPTKNLGTKPSQELLNTLLNSAITTNLTESYNLATKEK